MNWTFKQPKVSGYYWLIQNHEPATPVRVDSRYAEGTMTVSFIGGEEVDGDIDGENFKKWLWSGPIAPPALA